jgi:hypothetical protein
MTIIAKGKTTSMSAKGPVVFLGGRRYVSASRQRTKKEWAREVKSLVTEQYSQAEKVVLVMDNLSTHTLSSLYETFPAEEAFEIAQRLDFHYIPKHGIWLNIVEIELSAMTSQCLDRRIDTLEKLSGELGAWQFDRNSNQKIVNWQFTNEDARVKLHSLYPNI